MTVIAINAIRMGTSIKEKTMLFVASVICAAVANIADLMWNIGKQNPGMISTDRMWTINFMYFFFLCGCTYCWFLYTQTDLNGKVPSIKFCLFNAIPIFLLIALLIISYFNGCLFYFDENHGYHQGPLFLLQHVLAYVYILYASLVCLRHALMSENYARRDDLFAMASFVLPPIICTLFQLFFQTIPILAVGIVISFLLVFIQNLEGMVSKDMLTDIANRREMLRYLSAKLKNVGSGKSLYFMFIDIDSFKKQNDEYGHAEGDRALETLAAALKQLGIETGGFCARLGGDEFAFAVECSDDDEAESVKKRMNDLADEKSGEMNLKMKLSISVGYAKNKSGGEIASLISSADEAMYEEKAAKKAKRL